MWLFDATGIQHTAKAYRECVRTENARRQSISKTEDKEQKKRASCLSASAMLSLPSAKSWRGVGRNEQSWELVKPQLI